MLMCQFPIKPQASTSKIICYKLLLPLKESMVVEHEVKAMYIKMTSCAKQLLACHTVQVLTKSTSEDIKIPSRTLLGQCGYP